jgi:flavin-binding protein dodecin
MTNHTYKLVEIVGSSADGCDQAIQSAIAKAGETIKNIDWFEVVETRGHIEDGKVAHYQVTLKIGFRVS